MKPHQAIFKSDLHATIFEPADCASPHYFYTTLATIRSRSSHFQPDQWSLLHRTGLEASAKNGCRRAEPLAFGTVAACRRTKSWPWPPTPSNCVDQEPNLLIINTIPKTYCKAIRYDT
jgi:hypothetical protein